MPTQVRIRRSLMNRRRCARMHQVWTISVLSSRRDGQNARDIWTHDTTPIPWQTPGLVQAGKRSFVEMV